MDDRRKAPSSLENCGTPAGRAQHVKNGEKPCTPCKDAYAAYMRNYRAQNGRPKPSDRTKILHRAKKRAIKRLIEAYFDQYAAFLNEALTAETVKALQQNSAEERAQ